VTRRVLLATYVLLLLLSGRARAEEGTPQAPARPDVVATLRTIVGHLNALEARARPGAYPPGAGRELQGDVDALTTMINAAPFPSQARSVAQYTRARARNLQTAVLEADGASPDPALALGAVADLDAVIAAGIDLPSWGATVANAQYMAGIVAENRLHDESVAFAYWDLCAQRGHAGCLNIMAVARLTGIGGQKVDIKAALDLHAKVVDTGTNYACAGAYSALDIAVIGYFTGVHLADDGEKKWIDKANGLLDELAVAQGDRDLCNRAQFELLEFLLSLAIGTRDEDTLRHAVTRAEEPATKAAALYLSELSDADRFDAAMDGVVSPYDKCEARFDVLWYAQLTGHADIAKAQDDALKKIGFTYCNEQLVFARKFGFRDDGPQ